MIVLGASVLIAYLDGEDALHASAEALLSDVVDEDLGASPLTLAEVLVAPARAGRLEQVERALRDLEVGELALPPDTAVRLARLRAETGLRLPDCCVLLAAETSGAGVATFDEQLARAAQGRDLAVIGA